MRSSAPKTKISPCVYSFSQTVDGLYEAAADPSRWTYALGLVEELTGSAGAIVNLVSKSASQPTRMLAGERMAARYDEAVFEEYNVQLAPRCPRIHAGSRGPDQPYLCDHMILEESQMDQDPVYDFYTRQGVRYFVGSHLAETPDYSIMWSLQRSTGQQHAQAPDIELFLRLKPHVARAMQFALRFESSNSLQALNAALTESLPHGLFVLDAAGAVISSNTRGEKFLRDEDGVRSRSSKLCLYDPGEQATFERIVSACRISSYPGAMQVRRPSGRLPYILSVMPISTAERLASPAASIVVTLQDSSAREMRKIETLVQLFGFTKSEAALASALASGHSLTSAAHLQGISPSTARVHLKSVFRKARINRQADLVRLISSLSPFAPPLDGNGG